MFSATPSEVKAKVFSVFSIKIYMLGVIQIEN